MKEIGPVEKALAAIERFEREIRALKSELAAYLPDEEPEPRVDYLIDPVTGRKRQIKRSGCKRT